MTELKKDGLSALSSHPFSILLFYAPGCHHCEAIKPVFQEVSERYTEIGFYTIEANEGLEYFLKHAEDTQEVEYKKDEQGNVTADPVFNEDGSPKIVKKVVFPTFFVHHTDAVSEENPHGFIGGFDGALVEELNAVIGMITGHGE